MIINFFVSYEFIYSKDLKQKYTIIDNPYLPTIVNTTDKIKNTIFLVKTL